MPPQTHTVLTQRPSDVHNVQKMSNRRFYKVMIEGINGNNNLEIMATHCPTNTFNVFSTYIWHP